MVSPLRAWYRVHVSGNRDALWALRGEATPIPGIEEDKDHPRASAYLAHYDAVATLHQMVEHFQVTAQYTPPDTWHPEPFSDGARESIQARVKADPYLRSWLVTDNGPLTLKPFQYQPIWFADQRQGALWDVPAGGGKTLMSIVFAGLDPSEVREPVLVVTKNTVVTQFARSIESFVRTRALELPAQSKAPVRNRTRIPLTELIAEYLDEQDFLPQFGVWKQGPPYIVVGWRTLPHIQEAVLGRTWSTVIFDESHFAKAKDRYEWIEGLDGVRKGPATDSISSVAWQLSQRTMRPLAMTGTPVPHARRDWWGQLTLVSDSMNGAARGPFSKRYCDAQPGEYGWDDTGESHTAEFMERLAYSVITIPESVVDDELCDREIEVQIVAEHAQARVSRELLQEARRLAKLAMKGDREARGLLIENKLQQACEKKVPAVVERALDYLSKGRSDGEDKGKVLIFGNRHAAVYRIARALKAKTDADVLEGVVPNRERDPESGRLLPVTKVEKGGFTVLDGAERQAIHDIYMGVRGPGDTWKQEPHPGPCALCATGQKWGTGLDLQDTDLLIIAGLPKNTGQFIQWMRRVSRLGMTRKVRILIMLSEGTIEMVRAAGISEQVPEVLQTTGNESMGELHRKLLGLDEETRAEVLRSVGRDTMKLIEHDDGMSWTDELLYGFDD